MTERTRRTAAERVQADLDKAKAKVARLEKRVEADSKAAERIEGNKQELEFAKREVELLESHPALGGSNEGTEAPPFGV